MAFEFPGDVYETIRAGMRDVVSETDFLAGLLPAGGRVLDLGSGAGTTLRALAERGFEGVGVDESATFVDYAKGRSGSGERYAHASFADFETDETFDLVTCLFATVNMVDPAELPALLVKVRRMLKPGGRLVLEAAHLLNFVEGFQPTQLTHHTGADGTVVTRLARISVQPHDAVWRNEETLVVGVSGGAATLYHNFFGQWVLTAPELRNLLTAAGFRVTAEHGSFRSTPPMGRGPLIQVAEVAP
ncbi:class I SAM-dependent methyltransferase [Saccharothrix longispora]|uniref:class I SAM-dependent methyltransferase n=1 Tax=Saccharothrix longispora TaxID=33920 RepID=UPI0028FD38B8|nr:class I SAM-dependent methyltransferase [Saccharothrix longispora]MDU0290763.1 class I SAM-dependent methyltransferase [Saccharothrix longispora]